MTWLKRGKRLSRRLESIENLVIEIDDVGVAIRRFRCRTRVKITWASIAAIGFAPSDVRPLLEDADRPMLMTLLEG